MKQLIIIYCLLFSTLITGQESVYSILDTTLVKNYIEESRNLRELGKYAKALEVLDTAETIVCAILGKDNLLFSKVIQNKGVTYNFLGEISSAEDCFNIVFELEKKILGVEHPAMAAIYDDLGKIYTEKGLYEEAIECHKTAIRLQLKMIEIDTLGLAFSHRELGIAYEKKGLYEKAEENYLTALSHYKKILGENHNKTALVYNSLGILKKNEGNYDEALKYYELALKTHQELSGNEHPRVVPVIYNIANIQIAKGEFDKGIINLKSILEIGLKVFPNEPNISLIYSRLGDAFTQLGELDTAIVYHYEALEIIVKNFGEKNIRSIHTLHSIGYGYLKKGEYSNAENIFKECLGIARLTLGEKHQYVADYYNSLGLVYLQKDEVEKAKEYFFKALKVYSDASINNGLNISNVYLNLSSCFDKNGNLDKAKQYSQKAIDTLENLFGKDGYNLITAYINLGNIFFHDEEYNLAKKHYERAIQIAINSTDSSYIGLGNLYNNLGAVYSKLNDWKNAILNFNKAVALQINTYGNFHPEVGNSYLNLALTYKDMAKYKEALEIVNKSEKALNYRDHSSLEKVNSYYYLLQALNLEGSINKLLFDKTREKLYLNKAEILYKEANRVFSYFSNSLERPNSKVELFNTSYSLMEESIAFLYLKNKVSSNEVNLKQAFIHAEHSKSFLLLESMQNRMALRFANVPVDIINREKSFKINITYYEKRKQEKLSEGFSETDPLVLEIMDRLFDLKKDYTILKQEMENNYPDYYNLKYDLSSIDVFEVQNELLKEDQTLLEYFVGDSTIYAFVINKNDYQVYEIKKDFPLKGWIKTFRQANQKDNYRGMTIDYCEVAHQLYQKLVAPVAKVLKGQLIIIPDGILGYLPFEALLVEPVLNSGRLKNHHYLIEDKQISYCYSATLLREMREKQHYNPDASGLVSFAPFYSGDTTLLAELFRYRYADPEDKRPLQPLPNSGEEVYGIQKIIGGDVYYEADATESRFNEVAGNYQIIHLATHGKANDKVGDYSFLAFTEQKDSIENELLYVRDLYNLQLNADMVVLSACETGIGELQRGEGIISLARGFTYAGAKSIITSLWSVEDAATKDLMLIFYQHLKSGMTKDAALRQAKLDYLKEVKNTEKAHPFFWSGIIGIGDMRAIEMK